MKISGFTFVRNAVNLFYPVKQSILSVLPIVDEFVVALGDCDDGTEEEIRSIGSTKIKIVKTTWDVARFPGGMEYAHQTDIAKKECNGDWLFYIQCDEVIHEKYHAVVLENCKKYLSNDRVEGFLFHYKHFWGDFDHYVVSHAWYPREIRIIRNRENIHSWRDAQSFRVIDNFDGVNYNQTFGTRKLNVVAIDACIHHYGFVRPPDLMSKKTLNHKSIYHGKVKIKIDDRFRYGDLSNLKTYTESHPAVMAEWMRKFNWQEEIDSKLPPHKPHKHDKLKYRLLTFIEQKFLNGRQLFGFRNFKLINPSN